MPSTDLQPANQIALSIVCARCRDHGRQPLLGIVVRDVVSPSPPPLWPEGQPWPPPPPWSENQHRSPAPTTDAVTGDGLEEDGSRVRARCLTCREIGQPFDVLVRVVRLTNILDGLASAGSREAIYALRPDGQLEPVRGGRQD
jgi:hypothetical protein